MLKMNLGTKEQIIAAMCYTWRHDFGIHKDLSRSDSPLESGLTLDERAALIRDMKQLFENCIEPHMEFKK